MPQTRKMFDVLIIGAGIAGGSAAIKLADEGFRVAVLKRSDRERESSTSYAQGGIIGEGEDDSPELLAKDIDLAGDEVGSRKAIEILASEGPKLVDEFLIKRLGVNFDADSNGRISKTYEAAHARARIFHHKDRTGWEIQKSITASLLSHPNITIFSNHTAVDLISTTHHAMKRGAIYGRTKILGAYALDLNEKTVKTILASRVIIATGGIGALWARSSNPSGARGDGIAIAARAGASVINMEYMQFHPTAFALAGASSFLISEAVRGEGGVLRDDKGERFMFKFIAEDSRLEIADTEEEANRWYADKKNNRRPPELMPRDEVTRAISSHMRKGRSIFLDLSPIRERGIDLETRFPDIFKWCLENGLDLRRDLIPVAPAAHYLCGGIRVDEFGRTDKENLYAAGECSCTGLHGANRLASTSLLEGLTWGIRSAKHIIGTFNKEDFEDWRIPDWDDDGLFKEIEPRDCEYHMGHIKTIMWEHTGIVRSGGGLLLAKRILSLKLIEAENLYWRHKISDELVGLRNALEVAMLVITQARRNKFNRGCHFREDVQEA